MKGYVTFNLIPVEKLRRFHPLLPWMVGLAVLLVGQVAGVGWYYWFRVQPRLVATTAQADFYRQEVGRLRVDSVKLHELAAWMRETRQINAQVQAARGGVLDWTTLAGLLEGAAGGTTKIGEVTVAPGGIIHLHGTADGLPALNAFVGKLAPSVFQGVAVGSVRGAGAGSAAAGSLQFTLTAAYHPPGGGG